MKYNSLIDNEVAERELLSFTSGLGENETLVNGTYYANIGNGLKVKVYYLHNDYSNAELGLYVEIINPSIGRLDEQLLRFEDVWGDEGPTHPAALWKTGWRMKVTQAHKDKLAKAIKDFVDVYK